MPASDYATYDPDFSDGQAAQCRRIVDAVRTLNERVIRLSGSTAELSQAADRVETLITELDAVTGSRAMETFRFQFDAADPNTVMPFNPATGAYNPVAPKMAMRVDGNKLIADFAFTNTYESGPDAVQGGAVASFYDQLLAFVVMANGKTGFTASLKIDYVRPTLINRPLRFEGWVESRVDDKFTTRAECYDEDSVVSKAEALILGRYDMPLVNGNEGTPA